MWTAMLLLIQYKIAGTANGRQNQTVGKWSPVFQFSAVNKEIDIKIWKNYKESLISDIPIRYPKINIVTHNNNVQALRNIENIAFNIVNETFL